MPFRNLLKDVGCRCRGESAHSRDSPFQDSPAGLKATWSLGTSPDKYGDLPHEREAGKTQRDEFQARHSMLSERERQSDHQNPGRMERHVDGAKPCVDSGAERETMRTESNEEGSKSEVETIADEAGGEARDTPPATWTLHASTTWASRYDGRRQRSFGCRKAARLTSCTRRRVTNEYFCAGRWSEARAQGMGTRTTISGGYSSLHPRCLRLDSFPPDVSVLHSF